MLLAELNCSERAEFEDDSAVSLEPRLAVRIGYIIRFILEIDIAITRYSNASETIHCIEIFFQRGQQILLTDFDQKSLHLPKCLLSINNNDNY